MDDFKSQKTSTYMEKGNSQVIEQKWFLKNDDKDKDRNHTYFPYTF